MSKMQVLKKIKNQLEQLATTGATIHQEPYTSDLYKIFTEAAKSGYINDYGADNMHADCVRSDLIDIGVLTGDKNLEPLHSMWGDWSYVWNKEGLC